MRTRTTTRTEFVPTERDREIVAAVSTHRALTSDQVSLLFWGDLKANSRCRLRLRLLSEHGYLERAEQPVALSEGRRPLVYFLGKRGLALAADVRGVTESAIDWKKEHNDVRWPFLEHLLATNEIRVRLEVAAPRAGFTVLEWLDDKTLSSLSIRDQFMVAQPGGGAVQVALGPDGYVSLLDPNGTTRHRAFIEADRATVPLGRWQDKVQRYLAYFRSSVFADRYKATKPFRVLTVTTSDERLANMKRVTEEAGGQTWFWFSTFDAIREPGSILLRPVWHMAGSKVPVCFPYPPTEASGNRRRGRGWSASSPLGRSSSDGS